MYLFNYLYYHKNALDEMYTPHRPPWYFYHFYLLIVIFYLFRNKEATCNFSTDIFTEIICKLIRY